MFRGMNLLSACYIAFLSQLLLLRTCHSSNITTPCAASSCGRIQNISHPFRLDTDPQNCGNYNYTLICENNNSTVLYLYSGKYYVQAIDYGNYTIRVVDAGVQDNCCSIPRYSLAPDYFSYGDPYRLYNYKRVLQGVSEVSIDYWPRRSPPTLSQAMVYSNSSLLTPSNYVTDGGMNASDLMELCSIERIFLVPKKNYTDKSFEEIHNDLAYGFELSWYNFYCVQYCRAFMV
ncbi:receptor protein [Salix suchowensis]|nr:receptor protein [Salix suchowensis]